MKEKKNAYRMTRLCAAALLQTKLSSARRLLIMLLSAMLLFGLFTAPQAVYASETETQETDMQEDASAASETGTSFTKEDQAAYEALPASITTEYADEVDSLLEKLENADNQDEYASTLSNLQLLDAQIASIQADIDEINEWIAINVTGAVDTDDVSTGELLTVIDEVEALSAYDQSKIVGYDELVALQKELSGSARKKVLTQLVVFLVVLIVLTGLLDRYRRNKKKRKQHINE